MLLNLFLITSLFSSPAFCGKDKNNEDLCRGSSKKQKVEFSKGKPPLKDIDCTQSPLGFIRAIKAELNPINRAHVMTFYRPFLNASLAEVIENPEGVQKSDHAFLIELIDVKIESMALSKDINTVIYGQDFKSKLESARKKFSEDSSI